MSVQTVAQRNNLAAAYGAAGPYLTLLQALTLAANVSVGAISVSVDLSVAVGDVLTFAKGTASEETRTVTSVSGSGPYAVGVAALTYAHSANDLISHMPIGSSTVHEVAAITRPAANWGSPSNSSIASAVAAPVAISSGAKIGAVAVISASSGGTYLDSDPVPGQAFASSGTYTPAFTYTQS